MVIRIIIRLMGLEAVANSGKGTGFTFLVPLFQPSVGANGKRVIPHGFTLLFLASLLGAENPFVVTIPAVECLILGRETLVTGTGADLLDHAEDRRLLLVQLRDGSLEDL